MKPYDSNYGGKRKGAGRKKTSIYGSKKLIRLPEHFIPVVESLLEFLESKNYTVSFLKNFPKWDDILYAKKYPDWLPQLKKMCEELPPSTKNRSKAIEDLLKFVEEL